MSRLSVYWPDDSKSTSAVVEPVILRFPGAQGDEPRERLDVITRARVLFENRRCRHCSYPVVEPQELDDGLVNSTGLEIPGTATLVGFKCRSCRKTWSL
jgi:hypothetical protein